jgi:hypothetical protein
MSRQTTLNSIQEGANSITEEIDEIASTIAEELIADKTNKTYLDVITKLQRNKPFSTQLYVHEIYELAIQKVKERALNEPIMDKLSESVSVGRTELVKPIDATLRHRVNQLTSDASKEKPIENPY